MLLPILDETKIFQKLENITNIFTNSWPQKLTHIVIFKKWVKLDQNDIFDKVVKFGGTRICGFPKLECTNTVSSGKKASKNDSRSQI